MRFLVSVTRFVAIVAATAGLFIVVNAFAAPGDTVADRVFGSAGSFATSTANVGGLSASSLNTPSGIAFDSAGHLYVADFGNYRVLEYDNPLTSATANRVFGQGGSFTTSMCNNGGITANSFCAPTQLALDAAGHLYVVDSGNSRVLEYDNPLTSQTADRVFGQGGSFTSGTCGVGANGLCGPFGVAVDSGGHLYVADSGNNRVLEYDDPLTSQTANRVLAYAHEHGELFVNFAFQILGLQSVRLDERESALPVERGVVDDVHSLLAALRQDAPNDIAARGEAALRRDADLHRLVRRLGYGW